MGKSLPFVRPQVCQCGTTSTPSNTSLGTALFIQYRELQKASAPQACKAARRKPGSQEVARTLKDWSPVNPTTNDEQGIAASAATARKSFQMMVSASRQRAAPRIQSSSAAHVAQCLVIGYRGPLKLHHSSKHHVQTASVAQVKLLKAAVVNHQTNTNALRPNPPLNRTLCGGPSLGLKSIAQTRPTAKCRLALR